MRTEQTILRALKPKQWAIAVAKIAYERWQDDHQVPKEKRVKFEDDLMDYLCNGFVLSRPSIFWMMKIIDAAEKDEPKPQLAWFVRVAVGDLRELFDTLPARLPYMAFCRRGEGKIRRYPTEKFVALSMKFGGTTVERSIGRVLGGQRKCTKNNAG